MFFIGIFGVQSKEETIYDEAGVLCPVCGAYDRHEIVKNFNYFHIFFIPVWRWKRQYFLRTRCCQRICALDAEVGRLIEVGESVSISSEHVQCGETQGTCKNCGAQLDSSYKFCPYCGRQN